jgi:hypothetical protein
MTTSALILPVSGEQDLASWAAVAFVASYSSPGTRQAYATQVRLWYDWCKQHHLEPLADIRRPHVELYARDLEARGLAPATIALNWSCSPASTATASRNSCWITPRRSTYADRRSLRSRLGSASTGPSLARSSSRPGCPVATTTCWPACSRSTRCEYPKPAEQISVILRSPTATGPYGSSARATNRPHPPRPTDGARHRRRGR